MVNRSLPFIGRHQELAQLDRLFLLGNASLAVISGRRRIGKSRLVREFGQRRTFHEFSGLAPREGSSAQHQRDEFARQLKEQLGLPGLKADDWGDLFTLLAKHTQDKPVVILLDEISWMAMGDPDFLGKLKIAWDTQFSKNPQLVMVLCGSVSSWIEKNILSSTGFLGRPTLHMTLKELPLRDCILFWGKYHEHISPYEKLKFLSITGGVPRYLELLNPQQSAEENIRALCFNEQGALYDEFKRIFSDIYGKRSSIYQKIVTCLASGSATQVTIAKKTGIAQSGDLSEYLHDLVLGGFVSRDYTWHLKTGKSAKLSQFRLKDNYTRFYLKYIEPNAVPIAKGYYVERSVSTLPGWDSLLGLQFENCVLNNHNALVKQLNIPFEELVFDNPYFQRPTTRQRGCQIDYLIQTRYHCIYVCEIKFSRSPIKPMVIDEMRQKIARLQLPKHFSFRPVLIHVNGVHEEVQEAGYFSHIIGFAELMMA